MKNTGEEKKQEKVKCLFCKRNISILDGFGCCKCGASCSPNFEEFPEGNAKTIDWRRGKTAYVEVRWKGDFMFLKFFCPISRGRQK